MGKRRIMLACVAGTVSYTHLRMEERVLYIQKGTVLCCMPFRRVEELRFLR